MKDTARPPASPLLRIARGPHELTRPPLRPSGPAGSPRPGEAERCDLCAVDLAADHAHLVHVARRALLCVCRPCGLLFTHGGAARGLFRGVPDRYVALPAAAAQAAWWLALQVPVALAFFVQDDDGRVRACYPSPAGVSEADVSPDTWREAVHASPVLETLQPEVEALLVRARPPRVEGFVVPIDACYEIVGRLRLSWRGLSGGDEGRAQVDDFFARVAGRCGEALVR